MAECRNRQMQQMLNDGTCIDVNLIGVEHPHFKGVWVLENFLTDIDYCDAESESWIKSIGKNKYDGKIYASTDNRFYQNPLFVCLWLR